GGGVVPWAVDRPGRRLEVRLAGGRPSRTLTPPSVVLVVMCTDQLVQRVASVTLCVKIFLELASFPVLIESSASWSQPSRVPKGGRLRAQGAQPLRALRAQGALPARLIPEEPGGSVLRNRRVEKLAWGGPSALPSETT